jgi:hypothetical protein
MTYLAAIAGTVSTLFLALGGLSTNAKLIYDTTMVRHSLNRKRVKWLCVQHAQCKVGLFFLFMAFIAQMSGVLMPSRNEQIVREDYIYSARAIPVFFAIFAIALGQKWVYHQASSSLRKVAILRRREQKEVAMKLKQHQRSVFP